MFVRWKKRASRGNSKYYDWQKVRDVTLSAYLVKSERISGKPRQKVIAFLQSVHQHDLDREGWINRLTRNYFWYHVENKLRKLDLTDAQKVSIRETLQKTVPRLSEAERAEYLKEQGRLRSA